MVEGARLESVYTATYQGFESLPHRHKCLFNHRRKEPLGSLALSTNAINIVLAFFLSFSDLT